MTDFVRVTTESGILEGIKCRNNEDEGKEYFSFQGIPYAKPPVGELRFKAPQPIEPWTGIRKATQDGQQCYSRHFVNRREKLGSEDCLYLNVYTPNLPDVKNNMKPVMVFIHGGAYTGGSNSKLVYGPDYLIRDDIVLVTINYRLGLLGFLQLDDPTLEVPGNAGFKDMVLALRWVQKNIKYFNGDPNNVTLFGESAGASSVNLLMISPMSKGLFHKAIAQSGTALSIWARCANNVPKLLKLLEIEDNDQRKLYEKLSTMPVESLHALQEKLPDGWNMSIQRPAGFSIEPKDQKGEAFLTEEPEKLIIKGEYYQVPLLLGFNSREGMMVHIFMKTPTEDLIGEPEDVVPQVMGLQRGSSVSKEVAEKIRKFYYGEENPLKADIDLSYQLFSDNLFIRDIHRTTKLHLKTAKYPIYLYEMTIETNVNMLKKLAGISIPGVCHGDDLSYIFKMFGIEGVEPGSVEDLGIRRFCRMWTNFAKFGNPTPKTDELIPITWKPFDRDERYLDIGVNLVIKTEPAKERMQFWQDIFTYRKLNYKL